MTIPNNLMSDLVGLEFELYRHRELVKAMPDSDMKEAMITSMIKVADSLVDIINKMELV